MGLMSQEFTAVGLEQNEFAAFVQTMPFQFYAWLAVGMVPLMSVLKLDFGPMQKAEISARQDTHSSPAKAESDGNEIKGFTHANARPMLVWVPLAVLASVLCWQLVPLGFPLAGVRLTVSRRALQCLFQCSGHPDYFDGLAQSQTRSAEHRHLPERHDEHDDGCSDPAARMGAL